MMAQDQDPSSSPPLTSPLTHLKLVRLQELRRLQEEKRRLAASKLAQVDVFGALGYVPTPKQQLFHASTEFSVLFGGSAGGGKSLALLMEALRTCVRYPGIRIGAFRRTYPELQESLLAELARIGYAQALGAAWAGAGWELKFANGSTIAFRHAETMKDATRRQGGEYQMLVFDELTLLRPDVVGFLESRLRSGRVELPVLGVRASSNPGGPGHGAVKKRYIAATSHGTKIAVDERGRTVRFIPAKVADNPHINREYVLDLQGLADPKMRAAFLDGNWEIFAGMVFSDWSYDRHVIDPITLPSSWRRFTGIDYGYSAPFAVVWAAQDPDGRLWVYRDLSKTMVVEAEQAKMIVAAQGADESIAIHAADPSMWAKHGDAEPVATVYARNGVPCEPANNDRIMGWHRIHSYLAEGPACPLHRAQGWETCPRMHVFSTCDEVIRTVPELPHATKGNPEDADTEADDHIPDALRYLVMAVGGGAQFHFLDQTTPSTALDPTLEAPASHTLEHGQTRVPTIGGFPVANPETPWQ